MRTRACVCLSYYPSIMSMHISILFFKNNVHSSRDNVIN